MKYLEGYRIFESSLTKVELVNKIKYLSSYVHDYMKDYNKFTSSNLNFNFSYNTELVIRQIFEVSNILDINSQDGLITAVCNEFITWGNYFLKDRYFFDRYDKLDFQLDYDFENEDDYKRENRRKLYDSVKLNMLYLHVGFTISNLIRGTIWDIPPEKKVFTEADKVYILDRLISDYDMDENVINKASIMIDDRKERRERGVLIALPLSRGEIKLEYNSDFMYGLQSYFCGVLITNFTTTYGIYLPFYTSIK